MPRSEKIVILTGAGISAESGLGTFRGAGGLWENRRVQDVATPEGFARDPQMVNDFYNMRRHRHLEVQPNAAHQALARLQADHPGEVVLITQNVDRLHERGGSTEVLHMHGVIDALLCNHCGHRWPKPFAEAWRLEDPCPACDGGPTRPDVVWFGEMPYHLDEIEGHLLSCTLFAAIGTSGQVYPAAGFVRAAMMAGAHTVEINLEASAVASDFAEHIAGPATQTVPEWVDGLLAE
ncbi:NAD-dependent protein deacylase [Pseudooceanicola sp. 216_PA32_1]|uniref:NAD-dependent protein deacylase n=1 Tax=Pseudooceanicola pacificus TaxID=2676438 RepID=A0A844W3T7_9RHOB|nr:NAD-dependent deacylase [Pseudooceanicola pacificus]MWB77725.1 NAD-dependent protein deacylase [Pseudooceanicola pacificus]